MERYVQFIPYPHTLCWIVVVGGLIGVNLAMRFRKPAWLPTAVLLAGLLGLLFEPPEMWLAPILVVSIVVGLLLQAAKAPREERRATFWLVAVLVLMNSSIAWLNYSRPWKPLDLRLSSSGLWSSKYGQPVELLKEGLTATNILWTATGQREWVFRNPTAPSRLIRLWERDEFTDKDGRQWSGLALAQRVLRWADIEPIEKRVDDPAPGIDSNPQGDVRSTLLR